MYGDMQVSSATDGEGETKAKSANTATQTTAMRGNTLQAVSRDMARLLSVKNIPWLNYREGKRSSERAARFWQLEKGVAIEKVSKYVGHSSVDTTDKQYNHGEIKWEDLKDL